MERARDYNNYMNEIKVASLLIVTPRVCEKVRGILSTFTADR